MKHTIVTTGQAFADIDAVACVIAYAELLRLDGRTAEAYFPGALNNSVTRTIRAWGLDFVTTPSTTDAEFVVMDVSEPQVHRPCGDGGHYRRGVRPSPGI